MPIVDLAGLQITSPKLRRKDRDGWKGFYPYYAGFSLSFVENILSTSGLPSNSVLLDPWNGSGTSIFAAARRGYRSFGIDLNPAMLIVARARSLRAVDVDSIEPLLEEIVSNFYSSKCAVIEETDPLVARFQPLSASRIRNLERSIRTLLVSNTTLSIDCPASRISPLAAFFYVCLFSLLRRLLSQEWATNPTWLRKPSPGRRYTIQSIPLLSAFRTIVVEGVEALCTNKEPYSEGVEPILKCCDTAGQWNLGEKVDLAISSPPYCTRLDYAAATEIELAISNTLSGQTTNGLRRKMLGAVLSPRSPQNVLLHWGARCHRFLGAVRAHSSKASSGYYYRTHVDYFAKLDRSLKMISLAMRKGGAAVFVIQDSYYKDVHNDLAAIFTDMADNYGFNLTRKVDFPVRSIMSTKHQHVRSYRSNILATESVLCFAKVS